MKYDPEKHHRRSIRLAEYDYSQAGAYFVTLCTQHRECLFGWISDNTMHLSVLGEIVKVRWEQLPQRFPTIALDVFIVMPNHFTSLSSSMRRQRLAMSGRFMNRPDMNRPDPDSNKMNHSNNAASTAAKCCCPKSLAISK